MVQFDQNITIYKKILNLKPKINELFYCKINFLRYCRMMKVYRHSRVPNILKMHNNFQFGILFSFPMLNDSFQSISRIQL